MINTSIKACDFKIANLYDKKISNVVLNQY